MPGLDDLAQLYGQFIAGQPPAPPPQELTNRLKVPWNQQIADEAPLAGAIMMAPTMPAALAAVPAYHLMQSGKLGDLGNTLAQLALGVGPQGGETSLAGAGRPGYTADIANWMAESAVQREGGRPIRVYHGSQKAFEQPDISLSKEGLYGPGYYTTENPSVANSYANNQGNPSVPANVRSDYLNIKHPLDMDKPIHPDLNKVLDSMKNSKWQTDQTMHSDIMEQADLERSVRNYGDKKNITNGDLQHSLRTILGNGWDANDWFQANGFDGFTHQGGQFTGGKPHRVWIALNPDKQVRGAYQGNQ